MAVGLSFALAVTCGFAQPKPAKKPGPALPIQVHIGAHILEVQEFSRAPYVAWDRFADVFGLEHYFSEATGGYSLIDATPGRETAIDVTPGSRNITINGEVKKLPAVPLVKGGVLWLPVKPFVELMGRPASSLRFARGPAPQPPRVAPAAVEPTQPSTRPDAAPSPHAENQGPGPVAAATKPPRPQPTAGSPPPPTRPERRPEGLKLPPPPRVGELERERFGQLRLVLFARAAQGPRPDDPRATGAVRRLAELLQKSGFQVEVLKSADSWPAPPVVNALRPHLVLLVELSPRRDRFWLFHQAQVPAAKTGALPDGIFGPSSSETALARDLAQRIAQTMPRLTSVAGRVQSESNLVPLAHLVAAGLLLDFPCRVGASGWSGENAVARSIHDGIVEVLGERARQSAGQPASGAEAPAPPPVQPSPVASSVAGPDAPATTASQPIDDPPQPTEPAPVRPPSEPLVPAGPEPQPAPEPAQPETTTPAEPDGADYPPGIDTPATEGPEPEGIDTPATDETTGEAEPPLPDPEATQEPEDESPATSEPTAVPPPTDGEVYTPLAPQSPSAR